MPRFRQSATPLDTEFILACAERATTRYELAERITEALGLNAKKHLQSLRESGGRLRKQLHDKCRQDIRLTRDQHDTLIMNAGGVITDAAVAARARLDALERRLKKLYPKSPYDSPKYAALIAQSKAHHRASPTPSNDTQSI